MNSKKQSKYIQQPVNRLDANGEDVISSGKEPEYGYGRPAMETTETMFPMIRKAEYKRDKCMDCNNPPTVELLWAEGMAHCWFCDKHFEEFKNIKTDMTDSGLRKDDISSIRKLPFGVASQKWGDGVPSKKESEEFRKEFGSISSGGFSPTMNYSETRKLKKEIDEFVEKAQLFHQTPEQRRLKYKMAREAGMSSDKARWARELHATNFFRHLNAAKGGNIGDRNAAPSLKERRAMGIMNSIDSVNGDMNEIAEEATPSKPKSELQRKIIGSVKQFEKKGLELKIKSVVEDIEKNLENEQTIQQFLKGYERLALLPDRVSNEDINWTYILGKEVNIMKSYNIPVPKEEKDRLEEIIFIDSIAHNLHSVKFQDGSSMYKKLDELADISKSLGEDDRSTRLLLLESPENIKKLESVTKMDILYKGKVLEKSMSLWKLFEKSIKEGVEELTDIECVLLREWLYAKI